MDLLDYLTRLLDCAYLSDLHFAAAKPHQIADLMSIPESQFSLEQYQIALDYITGKHVDVSSGLSARQALIDALNDHALTEKE